MPSVSPFRSRPAKPSMIACYRAPSPAICTPPAVLGSGSFRVSWRGRSVAIRIAGDTVQARLVEGEGMEMRIAAETRKLVPGATLQVSV
jgi:hypothetical protein